MVYFSRLELPNAKKFLSVVREQVTTRIRRHFDAAHRPTKKFEMRHNAALFRVLERYMGAIVVKGQVVEF